MAGFASGKKSRRRTMNEINMVPFIDVMLVLLIILMVTAPMLTPGSIDIPTVGRGSNQPLAMASVNIDKTGQLQWSANGSSRTATLEEITSLAANWQAEHPTDSGVGIAADKAAQYEEVVKVLDALKNAGIQRVGLNVNINQGG